MRHWIALALVPLATAASAQLGSGGVVRVPLMTQPLEPETPVSEVRATRIELGPGQRSGKHLHPVPTMGVVLSGRVLLQVEGGPVQVVHAGESFYEPANRPVLRFDNGSDEAPARFAAFYLLGPGDEAVVRMLD